MDIQVHTDPADFGRLATSWNELLLRSENTSVFSRHEYLSTWLNFFGGDNQPFIVEMRDNGRVVGCVPLLCWSGEDTGHIELCSLGRFADYCDFVVEPGYEERVVSNLLDLLDERGAASLTLDHFREGTRVFQAVVDALRQRNLLFQPMAVTRAPYIRVEGRWEDYIRRLSRNTYRDLRKKLNRLAGTPGLEVDVIIRSDEYPEHVKSMLNMHLKLWFSRGIATPYKVPERRRFLEEVGRKFFEKGLLRFSCLKLEGRAVAYLWCYDHKGVRHYLNAAWDIGHAALSPGSLLLINDMRDAFENGLVEYDMLGGEEPYKYRYATDRRFVTTLVVDDMDRPRPIIRPLRRGSTVTGDTQQQNLLVTAHPDDEAIFFGALLRSTPEARWTHCLITAPSVSPVIREIRLGEFKRSCSLLGLEPVFLDLEEPLPGQSVDTAALAALLAKRFSGRHFHGVYSHGAFGEYGHPHHAAVSLATHIAFDDVWSLAGPYGAEKVLREEPNVDFPDKLDYFRDVHHSQLYLAELVSPEEHFVKLPRERALLIHRIFFERTVAGNWNPALTGDDLEQAKELFAPLFDAYFSRVPCPAELTGAARSTSIDVITSIQLRILRAALGVAAYGGRDTVVGFVRQLERHPRQVAPRAVGAARELMTLMETRTG
jgi:CelD/BcsL family acetyltransferase involved in cellulose biosynthesis